MNFHKSEWKTFLRAIRFVAKDNCGIWPMTFITAILEAAYPYIYIFLSAAILTELSLPDRNLQRLIFLVLLLGILNFAGDLLLSFCQQFLNVLQYILMQHLDETVARKAWQMDYTLLCDPEIHGRQRTINNWQFQHGMVAMMTQFTSLLQSLVTIGISLALTVEFFASRAAGDDRLAAFLNSWSFPALFLLLFALSTAYGIRTASCSKNGSIKSPGIQSPMSTSARS